jgi:hypothetical protein
VTWGLLDWWSELTACRWNESVFRDQRWRRRQNNAEAWFPKDYPLPLQAVNLKHLVPECNVKCEVLQLAIIDRFSANRIGAEEDQAVLAGSRNQSCRDR